MNERYLALAKEYQEEIIRTASEMLQINSQSTQEAAFAAYVQNRMKELGYDEVTVDECGNVFGTVRGSGGGSSVMLNCHLDVVDEGEHAKWKYPPFSGAVAEGRIWGRGASDTKGTMAVQLYIPIMLRKAGLLPKGDVVTACVVSEEIAGFGAMVHTKAGRMLTDYGIIGEATENDLAISCRGRMCVVITITGKSCHASIPHAGKNPFDMLGPVLCGLKEMEMGRDDTFGPSNMAVTRIVSSESGTNVIPNDVVVYLDYRQSSVDTEEVVLSKIQKVLDNCKMDGITAVPRALYFPITSYNGYQGQGYQGGYPFCVSPEESYVQLCKKTVEEAVGRPIKTKAWAFTTDTGHYTTHGVKCVGYSPAEIKLCHTTEDSISIAMMEESIVGYLALTQVLANRE